MALMVENIQENTKLVDDFVDYSHISPLHYKYFKKVTKS